MPYNNHSRNTDRSVIFSSMRTADRTTIDAVYGRTISRYLGTPYIARSAPDAPRLMLRLPEVRNALEILGLGYGITWEDAKGKHAFLSDNPITENEFISWSAEEARQSYDDALETIRRAFVFQENPSAVLNRAARALRCI